MYLATRRTSEGLEKRVAVKVLREDLPNAETALARLRDEARMLAVLAHPAIVSVVELTRLDGRIALVTEYVEGTDLSRFCAATSLLPARVACEAMAEVAGALCVANDTVSPETGKPLRLIHRDIKPENVRVSRHGEVKLLDFGIARSTEMSREARTSTGNVPFTMGYTAPETFLRLEQHPPSDVFALGATLFRLLTGERFYAGLKLTDQAGMSAAPERFEQWHAERMSRAWHLPPPLVELVGAMLAYAPEDRPTAAQVQQRLEALLPALPGPSVKKWARDDSPPAEVELEGPLVGKVLREDRADDSEVFVRRHPPAPPPAPKDLKTVIRPALRETSTDGPPRGASTVAPSQPGAPPKGIAAPSRLPWMAMSMAALLLVAAGVAAGLSVVLLLVWLAM